MQTPDGVVPDAEQELPGGVFTPTARPTGRAKGNHGGGSQAGADRVPPDEVWGSVHEAGGVSLRRAGAAASGEEPAPASQGDGLRAEEDRATAKLRRGVGNRP